MILTRDNLKLGLVLGLIGPLAGLFVFYLVKFPGFSFREFLQFAVHNKSTITSVSTFSLLVNALLFAVYVHFDKTQTFKGIFIITMIYGIGILLLKLFI